MFSPDPVLPKQAAQSSNKTYNLTNAGMPGAASATDLHKKAGQRLQRQLQAIRRRFNPNRLKVAAIHWATKPQSLHAMSGQRAHRCGRTKNKIKGARNCTSARRSPNKSKLLKLGSLEPTPPQVGHGFLKLCFWGPSPGGPGNLSKRWGSKPPTFWKGFPGPRGTLNSKNQDLENRARPAVGYGPSCLVNEG